MSSTTSLVVTTGHIDVDLKTGVLVNRSAEAEFNAIFCCLDAALKNAEIAEELGILKYLVVCYCSSVSTKIILRTLQIIKCKNIAKARYVLIFATFWFLFLAAAKKDNSGPA